VGRVTHWAAEAIQGNPIAVQNRGPEIVAAVGTFTSARSFNRVHLWLSMVLLANGFASVAWTRLNIAIILPEVMQGIGVTSLAVGGFLATLSVLGNGLAEPFMGHLSDRIGRRLALTIGLAGFSVLSMITALATNLPEMIAIRVLLGVLQGLYVPTYLAFVGGTFENRRGFWIEGPRRYVYRWQRYQSARDSGDLQMRLLASGKRPP
jgi:MFS family permease